MLKRKKIDQDVGPNPTITLPLPGRQIERKRGCWNCISWDAGEAASKLYHTRRGRDAKVLEGRGFSPTIVSLKLEVQDAGMKPPRTGLCLIGAAKAEFTFPEVLCSKWTGRQKVEGKLDALAGELWDKLGEKPPEGVDE